MDELDDDVETTNADRLGNATAELLRGEVSGDREGIASQEGLGDVSS